MRKAQSLLVMLALAGAVVMGVQAQQMSPEIGRRVKSKVQPVYPVLARKMKLSGTVKVEIVVMPNGSVKDARVVGGHPVLASAVLEAVKKWRFEPAAAESSGMVEFKFESQQ